MAILHRSRRLHKELTLLGVYAIGTGTTLSAGFFLLPGLAAKVAGPAIVLSYLLAVLPLIPATYSMVELSTAMPRAGGAYYYLDRSMGPLVGTVGGMGAWITLVLKASFALIGIGAYLRILLPALGGHEVLAACALALVFGAVNLAGARRTGTFQVLLVAGLLAVLTWFVSSGLPRLEPVHFEEFFAAGFDAIFATAGLVYISYVGVTQVASVSEEIKNPERNLPLGVMLAMGTAILVYGLGTTVMVGVLPLEELRGNLTPVAAAAARLAPGWGAAIVTVGALLAFCSVANASILSASRYPLAMSRDHLLPRWLRLLTPGRTPWVCIAITVAFILAVLLFLNPTRIAKLASAFQLLLFAGLCLAVIVMRESHIPSYDPGYRSPGYPYLQVTGVLLPLLFLAQMGWVPILFTLGLLAGGAAWYLGYARYRVQRAGAVFHVFARLGHSTSLEEMATGLRPDLDEIRTVEVDPYDDLLARTMVLDLPSGRSFEEVTRRAAELLAEHLPHTEGEVARVFMQGTAIGTTVMTHGVALPHFREPGLSAPVLLAVRIREGVPADTYDPFGGQHHVSQPLHAILYLVSPEALPALHLQVLARLAQQVEGEGFLEHWMHAPDAAGLKEALLREERSLTLTLNTGHAMVGRPLQEAPLPSGCLVALVRREGEIFVPSGTSLLQEGDRLTILGNPGELGRLAGEELRTASDPG